MLLGLLKLFSVLALISESLGVYFTYASININHNIIELLLSIGRVSFPLLAFVIINEYEETKDKSFYFLKLCILTLVTQIPHSIVSAEANYGNQIIISDFLNLSFSIKPTLYIVLVAIFLLSFVYINREKIGLNAITIILCFFSIVNIESQSGFIINNSYNLNLFYNLIAGLYIVDYMLNATELYTNNLRVEKALSLVSLLCAMYIYSVYSAYSIFGLILVIFLYFFRKNLLALTMILGFWTFIWYGTPSPNFLRIGLMLVVIICVLIYARLNKVKNMSDFRPKLNSLISWFYPLALVILSVQIVR